MFEKKHFDKLDTYNRLIKYKVSKDDIGIGGENRAAMSSDHGVFKVFSALLSNTSNGLT